MRRSLVVTAGVAAAVLNANFLLELVLPTGISTTHSIVSELSAVGRPWSWLFRTGDAVSGVLAVVVAVAFLQARRSRRDQLLGWCVALFGAGTAISAVVSLPCADGTGVTCSRPASVAELVHDGASVLGTTAAVAGTWLLVLHVLAEVRRPSRGGAVTSEVTLAAAIATAAVATGAGAVFVVDHAVVSVPVLGLAQRAQILALSAWVLAVALLSRSSPAGLPSARGRASRLSRARHVDRAGRPA